MKPRLLDLFAAEGGASAGYQAAGFHVTAVDLDGRALSRNPADVVVQADALDYLLKHGHSFDAVHASPPCHDHTTLAAVAGKDGTEHLLPHTLAALAELSVPWAVENVEGARSAMPGALTLCGAEFSLSAMCKDGQRRYLRRHRLFLSNVWLWGAGGCCCSGLPIAGVYGDGGGGQQTRGYRFDTAEVQAAALGTPWMTRKGMSLCIPPAYARHIGEQLLHSLAVAA